MPEYQLYCFAQSGNCYRAALMLNLIGADWKPVYVDFFAAGETRTPKYREEVNEMGEAPVLAHGEKKISQSGVILTYLARRSGKFLPQGEDEELEALRWIIFDNQKTNGFLGPYRFLDLLGHGALGRVYRGVRLSGERTFVRLRILEGPEISEDPVLDAIEANGGDIFQLGNASWRVLQVKNGRSTGRIGNFDSADAALASVPDPY